MPKDSEFRQNCIFDFLRGYTGHQIKFDDLESTCTSMLKILHFFMHRYLFYFVLTENSTFWLLLLDCFQYIKIQLASEA